MAPKSREHVTSDIESSDDEGIKNLDYKPPRDFTLHKAKKHTTSVFDVDEAVKHELWLIRVPEGVSNEDLATMSISLPSSTKPKSSKDIEPLGTLKKKETSFNSSSSTTIKYQLQTVAPDSGVASEMLALQPLIPDASKGGRLVQAPLGVHHHLALVASTSIPSGATLGEEILARPIPKREQPEGLKARFQFTGAETHISGNKAPKSGKKFAQAWPEMLEKRKRTLENDAELNRKRKAAMEAEARGDEHEETEEVEEEAAEESQAEEQEEEEEEVEAQPSPAKKRKGEDMEVEGVEEKKSKKEKKDKKEKKEKKNKD
ncbi:MAG: hypothetical protein J3R72DRAFT_526917 [Linnemannia gamsii]|nr:MAG: hypothetical protein J3R72DRAFT_526917 [Linnemannia gamsii]